MSTPNDSTDANRRSLKRVYALADRERMIKGRAIVAALFALPALAVYATHLLINTIHHLVEIHAQNVEIVQPVVNELSTIAFLFIGIILLLCLMAIYFVFFVSVRIYGPQVALVNFITQLKSGDYRPYRKLRKDDELQEIWRALQDLASELGKKT